MIGPLESLLTLLMALIYVIPFRKMFQKAGDPGWYFIFIFIPLENLIALHYFAYTEWPIHKVLKDAGIEFPPEKSQ